MNCQRHPFDQLVGVCARCLQERLASLATASAHSNSAASSSSPSSPVKRPTAPQPLELHRSAIDGSQFHRPLFFSTPQLRPCGAGDDPKKPRFSILSILFGPAAPPRNPPDPGDLPPTASSSSWLSSLVPARRCRARVSAPAACRQPGPCGRTRRTSCQSYNRGMSPDYGEEGTFSPPGSSDYSSNDITKSPAWRVPAPTPMRRFQSKVAAASGFAVCFSPLVRACPQRRSQVVAGDVGYSGELRAAAGAKPGWCRRRREQRRACGGVGEGAAALGYNRSRKLADMGKFQ